MFKFAIITDTHIRVPGGDLSSPFPVNEKANDRARYACHLIQAQEPDFTVHLGDMVHPLPHMDVYQDAVAEAHQIFQPLKPDLYFVPGNHDIGDKPSPGMPAKAASTDSVSLYESSFGPGWQSFMHQGVLFVIVNSSLVNSGTDKEAEQKAWLERTLNDSDAVMKFIFSHYPPYLNNGEEPDHYDNYAEPGRHWLLELAANAGVKAIFSGHVHHFFFNRYKGVNLHCLPPTSFTRQDYAGMFAVGPAPEFGRDDQGKYSVCMIEVDESSYQFDILPTEGRRLGQTDSVNVPASFQPELPLVPHLRHAWFESCYLPYNGPMEEFERKPVRNDYPLLRLLQLGLTTVRIPLSDLDRPEAANRIHDWIALGFRFVFFTLGIPDAASIKRCESLGHSIAALEVMTAFEELSDIGDGLQDFLAQTTFPVQIAKITTSAEMPDPTVPYAHAVSSGFRTSRAAEVYSALQALDLPSPTGLVFQLEWGQSPAVEIPALFRQFESDEIPLTVNIRLANSNPAIANFSVEAIAAQLNEAIEAAAQYPQVALQCDTFEDIDRGYNPRYGLIDRLGNLRLKTTVDGRLAVVSD